LSDSERIPLGTLGKEVGRLPFFVTGGMRTRPVKKKRKTLKKKKKLLDFIPGTWLQYDFCIALQKT